MLKLKTIAAAVGLMALPAISQAATPTLSDVLKASGITFSGAIDASYDYNDADTVANRQFDTNINTFSLHQVNLLVTKDFGSGLSATANVILGDDAGVLKGIPTASSALETALFQGYVSYASGALTVSGGRMATLAGYEVVNPAGNTTASRSLLFFNQPLVHTGVRASYKLSDMVGLTFGVHNSGFGVNTVDNNSNKTVEAQLALTPSSAFSVYLTGYTGKEDPDTAVAAQTDFTVIDLVATYTLSDTLSVAINADVVEVDDASTGAPVVNTGDDYKGLAAYVTAKVMPKLSVTVRGEFVSFENGAGGTSGSNDITGLTVAAGYSVTDALTIITEIRGDSSTDNTFSRHSALANPDSNYQNSASIKGILRF